MLLLLCAHICSSSEQEGGLRAHRHGYRTRGAALGRSDIILPGRRAPHGQGLVDIAHEGLLHAVQLQAFQPLDIADMD